jgi:hypothetical protein
MDFSVNKLLCIDLQVDPTAGLEPEPRAIFGARQLLAMGRRLGWTIAHARRRNLSRAGSDINDPLLAGIRPLMSERVFLRTGRAVTEAHGLMALLEEWRDETVYVAAFDHIALMSLLLAAYDHGPHLVLVEDALAAGSPHAGRPSLEAFRTVQGHLASGATRIRRIISGPQHSQPAA